MGGDLICSGGVLTRPSWCNTTRLDVVLPVATDAEGGSGDGGGGGCGRAARSEEKWRVQERHRERSRREEDVEM